MNTRLQVEHPVTEAIFDVDLVALQIAVAEGGAVPSAADPVGHAIEVRLYAEDPAQGWQPQSGHLTSFEIPGATTFARSPRARIRVDSGFAAGNDVSTHYDAMLAKVIAWAPTRPEAPRLLAGALPLSRFPGLLTNPATLLATLPLLPFPPGSHPTTLLA